MSVIYINPYQFAGALWTPAELGASLALWLDADDAATISLNGSTVSTWTDKSGNDNHVSNDTPSTQPDYLATGWNGKPTVFFTKAGGSFCSRQECRTSPRIMTSRLRLYLSFSKQTMLGTWLLDGVVMPTQTFLPNGGSPVLQGISSVSTQIGVHNTDIAATIIKVDVTSRLGKKIATVSRAGGTNGNGGAVTVTSTGFSQPTYQTDATQTWSSAAATGFQIGGRHAGGAAYGDKYISEVVGCNTKLSTADRQKLEGYLAWKWGLEANLPADHPYKTTPPTA